MPKLKVCVLIPCLMKTNNEEVNMKKMRELHDVFHFDKIVIYDQCFEERHIEPWMTLIGHAVEPEGFVVPRNSLLDWFYRSDYDYALWMDANASVSKPQRNALLTLLKWIEEGNCPYDVIQSMFQLWVSGEGILDHRRSSYDKTILVSTSIDSTSSVKDGTMIGLIISNFKKKYNDEVFIREDCNPWKGLSEDVFFINLVRRLYDVGFCSSLGFSKSGGAKTSTWREGKTYSYPPIEKDKLDSMIKEYIRERRLVSRKTFMAKNSFEISRVETYKELIKPFKPKNKKIISNLLR